MSNNVGQDGILSRRSVTQTSSLCRKQDACVTVNDLARFEQIKKFTLMPKEFTIADDELTPTLKVKRKVVSQKYADIIDKMYVE